MIEDFYKMVERTIKDGEEILKTITPKQLMLLHSSHDLSEETGELQEVIKRHVFYNQPINREHAIEELGDVLANVYKIRKHLGVTENDIFESAINKISKRYPDGYNDSDAKTRMDKKDQP